jgi:hypothetical protein
VFKYLLPACHDLQFISLMSGKASKVTLDKLGGLFYKLTINISETWIYIDGCLPLVNYETMALVKPAYFRLLQRLSKCPAYPFECFIFPSEIL